MDQMRFNTVTTEITVRKIVKYKEDNIRNNNNDSVKIHKTS